MKKSAVNWMIEEMIKHGLVLQGTHPDNILFHSAKQREKEQNEYFFDCGRNYQLTGEGTFTEVNIETYKP